LSECDEQLASRQIFPAIAREKADALADVVVLRLQRQLHFGREVDHGINLDHVNIDAARR